MVTVGDTPCPRPSSSSSSQCSLSQPPPTSGIPLSPHLKSQSLTGPLSMSAAQAVHLQMNAAGGLNDYEIDGDLGLLASGNQDEVTPKYIPSSMPSNGDSPVNPQWQHPPVEAAEDHIDHDDLDETLKEPTSLAAEVDFNDEEEWHSFSQGSPVAQVRDGLDYSDSEVPNGSMLSVEVGALWSSPIRREQLNDQGLPVFRSPLPSSMLSRSTANPEISKQHPSSLTTKSSTYHESSSFEANGSRGVPRLHETRQPFSRNSTSNTSSHGSVESEVANAQQTSHVRFQQLPPPSALVAKLFPSLRREKESAQTLDLNLNSKKPKPAQVPAPQLDKVPSPTSSIGGDSGKGSLAAGSSATSMMNEELRKKLCLLETEIERFKSENAALEKLRMEKEEVSDRILLIYVKVHAPCGDECWFLYSI